MKITSYDFYMCLGLIIYIYISVYIYIYYSSNFVYADIL